MKLKISPARILARACNTFCQLFITRKGKYNFIHMLELLNGYNIFFHGYIL